MEIYESGVIDEGLKPLLKVLQDINEPWYAFLGKESAVYTSESTSIPFDAMIISPTGIFFLFVKNIRSISKKPDGTFEYKIQDEQELLTFNPFHSLQENVTAIKKWMVQNIPINLMDSQGNPTFMVHGIVVLPNTEEVKLQDLSLTEIPEYMWEAPILTTMEDLTQSFFNAFPLPEHSKNLSKEEMFFLFHLLHNSKKGIIHTFATLYRKIKRLSQGVSIEQIDIQEVKEENIKLTEELENLQKQLQNNNTPSNREQEKDRLLIKKEQQIRSLQNAVVELTNKEEENMELMQLVAALEEKNMESKAKLQEMENKTPALTKYKVATLFASIAAIVLSIFVFTQHFSGGNENLGGWNGVSVAIANHYNSIIEAYSEGEVDEVIQIWQEEILQHQDFPLESYAKSASIFFYVAASYDLTDKVNQAIQYYQLFLDSSSDTRLSIDAHNNLGLCYVKNGSYNDAINHYTQALELNRTSLSDKTREYTTFVNLGHCYEDIALLEETEQGVYVDMLQIEDFHQKAIDSFDQAATIAKNIDDIGRFAKTMIIKAQVYHTIDNPNKAISTLSDAITLLKSDEAGEDVRTNLLFTAYYERAKIHYQTGKIEDAYRDFSESLYLANSLNVNFEKMTIFRLLAIIDKQRGDIDQAISNLSEAIEISKEIPTNDHQVWENELTQWEKQVIQ